MEDVQVGTPCPRCGSKNCVAAGLRYGIVPVTRCNVCDFIFDKYQLSIDYNRRGGHSDRRKIGEEARQD
jgi:rubredoxin